MDAFAYLRAEQQQNGQGFIKFVWPEDHEIPQAIISYLGSHDFSLEVLECYAIKPERFTPTSKKEKQAILIDWARNTNRNGYLAVSAIADKEVSEDFAAQKQVITVNKFWLADFNPIIAMVEGQVAGSIDLYMTEETIEIDSLYVLPSFRRKGVGTALEEFVMDHADGRSILLVADASDTAREMYNRQNYAYMPFRYELLKLL